MRSYFKYRYQNGGSMPRLPSLPASLSSLPPGYAPVSQMLPRPGSMGDLRANAGLPNPSEIRQHYLLMLAAEEARKRAEVERIEAEKIEAEKEKQRKKFKGQMIPDSRMKGDLASNFNIPTSEQARQSVEMKEVELEKTIRDKAQLQHNLERMGYEGKVARSYANLGWEQMPKSAQKALEDLAAGDMRVEYHPDFDASLPIEEQQALKYDNSLRTGLLRQRNKLINSDNPVVNFLTEALTAPAKSFINLTMDSEKQYFKPGLVEGVTNLGNDLMTVFPSGANQVGGKIVNGMNRISPNGFGREAFAQLFERRGLQPVTSATGSRGAFVEPVPFENFNFEYVPNRSSQAINKLTPENKGFSVESSLKAERVPIQIPKGYEERVRKAAMDYGNLVEDPRYLKRVKALDKELGLDNELQKRRELFLQQMDDTHTNDLPFNIKVGEIPGDNAGSSLAKADAVRARIEKDRKTFFRTKMIPRTGMYPSDDYYKPWEREITISPQMENLGFVAESTTPHELKHHWTNGLVDHQGGIQNYANWLRKGTASEINAAYKRIHPDDFMYYLDPTEIDAHLMTELRGELVKQNYMKDPFSKLKEDQLKSFINKNTNNPVVQAYFRPGQELVSDNKKFLNIFNKALPAVVPAAAVIGSEVVSDTERTYQYGGISTQGYKSDSPDRFNQFNIIPSNNITMKNVRHPVLGIDNTGATKVMRPGYDYLYPGAVVLELPFKRYGGMHGWRSSFLPRMQAGGNAAPLFKTAEERENYRKRLSAEAEKALGPEDDINYLSYNSYHPKPDGYDCINGVCGLDLRAGLRYSNPTDGDRYLSNTRFADNIQAGKEDYYQVDGNFQVGDHFQYVTEEGTPTHSMKLYKIEKDENNNPLNYHFIHNSGDTKFQEKVYNADRLKKAFHPDKESFRHMIAWRPGKTVDKSLLANARTENLYPFDAGEEQVEKHFGDTYLPTRFWLKAEESNVDSNSPAYYFSGKNVEDDTKSELMKLMNDKELDRMLREKLHVSDSTLQNLKPVIFGIAGVESNFDHVSGSRALKEDVAEIVSDNPSVGPFQIRLGSVSDRAKKAFDINKLDDLKDVKKGYMAAVDRMLEGKRVTDAMIEKGYHPELENADPYFRAAYYYNQPQKVLQRDEDWARENFEDPTPRSMRRWMPSTQEELNAEYSSFLDKSRLRGDEGSYMNKVQRAAYPLGMEVLDDADPTSETGIATLPNVQVVGLRRKSVPDAVAYESSPRSEVRAIRRSAPRPRFQVGGWNLPGVVPSWVGPIQSIYDRLNPNPFPGMSPLNLSAGMAKTENPIGSVNDRLKPNPFPGMSPRNLNHKLIGNMPVAGANNKGRTYILPGLEQTTRGPNIPAALGVVSGMSFLGNALEAKDRNKYEEWKRLMGLGDSAGPVVPGSRGDYTLNEGYFRPDQYTPVQFGAIPYAQYGGYFDAPKELSPIGQTAELLQSFGLNGTPSSVSSVSSVSSAPADMKDMGTVDFRSTGKDVATKTNNPSNMKWHNWMSRFGGYNSGIKGDDGGEFAAFPNIQLGLKAYQTQLFGDVDGVFKSSYYKADTPVDKALKTWSNKGYGEDIYPKIKGKTLGELSQQERFELMKRQIKNESGKMYQLLSKAGIFQTGGETGNTSSFPTRRLKPQEMQEWNQFLDYVKQSGYEGSKDLNVRDKNLGSNLFTKFKSSNPGITIGYDIVPSVQNEIQLLKQQAQDFARRRNDPNADNLMKDISPVDNWFGSQTSQYRFPSLVSQDIYNGQVVQNQDQGLVNGNLQPTTGATNLGTVRTVKKALPAGAQLFQNREGMWMYEDPQTGDLVRYQQGGGVVDHFKKEMLKQDGKYLITDKGTNRTYYGYPGPDGKLIEDSFEVLTGKTSDINHLSPYSLAELEKMSEETRDKAKITPVGDFPLRYGPNIYGNPGLHLAGTSAAMHLTYDPQVRGKYYNNNNPADNYASYGCINCRKQDINNVLKGFGNKDHTRVVDSRRSVKENNIIAQENEYLSHNPAAARMLFEQPGSRFVKRQWNAAKGVYEGNDSDYDPETDTIISKKDLGNVTVSASKKKAREMRMNVPVSTGNVSIVDYLNERGIDSSKANRMQLAHSLGMDDYAYTAADNINLLRTLERMQEEGSRTVPEDVARQMRVGGDVDAEQRYNLRQTLGPVDREMANIEAERGETISGDFDQDGMNEHLSVGGQRHSSGGTPLSVPPGSFVFSDTKKMKIGGDFLQEFGKSAGGKKKYTPAELSKQYEIEKYKAIILDPASDKMDKDTAKLMLENNQLKLSKLALLQEGMKGFPNGIPGIALPLIQTALAMNPNMNAPMDDGTGQGQPPMDDRTGRGLFLQDPNGGVDPNQMAYLNQAPPPPMEAGEMRYGGLIKAAGGYSDPQPIDPYKGDKNIPRKTQREKLKLDKGFNKFDASWLKDYGYGDDAKGLEDALLSVGYKGNLNNVKDIQNFLIERNLEAGNYSLFNNLLGKYGMTNQGIEKGVYRDWGLNDDEELSAFSQNMKDAPNIKGILEKSYADGLFGVRSGLLLKSLLPPQRKGPYGPPATSLIPHRNLDFTPLRPGEIKFTPLQIPPAAAPAAAPAEDPLQWKRAGDMPMDWWTQDMLNTGAAFGNRYGLKKYGPTYVSPDVVAPRSTFFDDKRQLAANQEQAAAQNMMAAMYAGPQRQRGVGSNIQGQAASNAANIIGQVQNQNVGVANQFAGVTSDILNKKAMQDAIARKTYMDELAVANQQYDNSKMLGNANILTNLNSGITNAQETYWLNKMNDQFAIDPRSGRLSFTKGKSSYNTGNSNATMNDAALYNYYYNQFKQANPGMSDADAKAYATMQLQDRLRSNNNGAQAGGIGIGNYMGLPIGQGGGGGGK